MIRCGLGKVAFSNSQNMFFFVIRYNFCGLPSVACFRKLMTRRIKSCIARLRGYSRFVMLPDHLLDVFGLQRQSWPACRRISWTKRITVARIWHRIRNKMRTNAPISSVLLIISIARLKMHVFTKRNLNFSALRRKDITFCIQTTTQETAQNHHFRVTTTEMVENRMATEVALQLIRKGGLLEEQRRQLHLCLMLFKSIRCTVLLSK